ncbi:MAG: polyphenol oxidase family protein, partial [Candidatus Neomarinimicrobiota bacterium]
MPVLPSILDYSSYFTESGFRAGVAFKNARVLSNQRHYLAKILGLNPDLLAIPEQVHSNGVIKIEKPGRYGNIDGLMTINKKIVLSIQTADCVPIFLFDKNTRIFGLVHAGWRGTLLGIAGKTIKIFKKHGADPVNIRVLLGPSIGQCCFETGPDVWKKFPEEFLLKGKKDRYY